MHPCNPAGQSGSQNQRSLSSTTDPSRHSQALAPPADPSLHYQNAGFQAHAYASQQQQLPYHQHNSQYGAMAVAQPSYQQSMQYVQTPQAQQAGYGAPGYGLRDLPFTNAYQGASDAQRSSMYAGQQPMDPSYSAQSYAHMSAHGQYGMAAAAPLAPAQQNVRYIPTPAQTMQAHQYPTGRGAGAGAGASIVIPPQSSPSPGVERYPCDRCDRTFSRPHDRKRHYESQHMMTSHTCQYCRKDFSRADSLKRHLDNGCDKMPPP